MVRFVFLFVLFAQSAQGQNASDYLCLDSTVVLHYVNYQGDPFTLQFQKSFSFEGDTVCYYTRRYDDSDRETTIYYTYQGKKLTIGNAIVNKRFSGTTVLDTEVFVVRENETTDSTYLISFDMDVSEFIQTTRLLDEYSKGEGSVFYNVLEVDQFNKIDDFHYITLLAPGIGVISQGGREMEFVRKEKEK